MSLTYQDLGWSAFFDRQRDAGCTLTPMRISAVHRDRLTGLAPDGENALLPPSDHSTGDFAVGDWVLCDDAGRIVRLLDRNTELTRRAAGSDARAQLIAANVDVLYITSSCNADFSPARLERYLALATQAGCYPVMVLTKADLSDDPRAFATQAEALAPFLTVLTVNAFDPDDLTRVLDWCRPGQTAALVGSSGVGKTTLTNGLTGARADTANIREDDARGRHTTTARELRRMINGGWLIDTPGMRALRLFEAGDGIDEVFADLADLAGACRFGDCSHVSEPGCAVQAAIAAGDVDPDRLKRWQKLQREDRYNSETLAQSRARDKAFGKMVRGVMRDKSARKRN
jgi:ribosome biogenesis GTPase / thiamine phosphate phosphatase